MAAALDNLSVRCTELHRLKPALAATEEGLAIRRRLANERPEVFRQDVARALKHLGADLAALGRQEEALQATEEAVGVYRHLATQAPEAHLSDETRP